MAATHASSVAATLAARCSCSPAAAAAAVAAARSFTSGSRALLMGLDETGLGSSVASPDARSKLEKQRSEGDESQTAMPFPKEVAQDVLDAAPDRTTEEQLPGASTDAASFASNMSTSAFKGHKAAAAATPDITSDVVSGEANERAKVLNAERNQQEQQSWQEKGAGEKVAMAKAAKGKVLQGYNKVADAVGNKVASQQDARDTT